MQLTPEGQLPLETKPVPSTTIFEAIHNIVVCDIAGQQFLSPRVNKIRIQPPPVARHLLLMTKMRAVAAS